MALAKISNIEAVHNAGYKGDGRPAVTWDMRGDIHDYFRIHPEAVQNVYDQVAPNNNSHIVLLTDVKCNIREILKIANGRRITVNVSLDAFDIDFYYDTYKKNGDIENVKLIEQFFEQCLFVCSSGNDQDSECNNPGATEHFKDDTIITGACDEKGRVLKYSNYGKLLDLVNPAGTTMDRELYFEGEYLPIGYPFIGTSSSSPVTQGQCDLIRHMFLSLVGREATNWEITDRLLGMCVPTDDDIKDGAGYVSMEVLKMKTLRLEFPFGKDYYIQDGKKITVECDTGTEYLTTSIGGNTVVPFNIITGLFNKEGVLHKRTIVDSRKEWDDKKRIAYFEFDYI